MMKQNENPFLMFRVCLFACLMSRNAAANHNTCIISPLFWSVLVCSGLVWSGLVWFGAK